MKKFTLLYALIACGTTLATEVIHHVLDNGLTVLIHQVETSQPVAIKLFYNVGSKHEDSSQKGIAHLLEHMVFKGTDAMSETDIQTVCHKLSAQFNAATCHDWTMFYFIMPLQHWHHALPMLADCMCNCTFKPDLLNAELHVVIQELKMYRDHYVRSLIEKLDNAIFADHPYHYPVIGFKDDLWHMTHDNLMRFYKKHYHPNNAVLVVVGNVEPDDVIKQVEQHFGHIPQDETYTTHTFAHTPDTCTTTVTIYRDVSQPQVILVWEIPGQKKNRNYPWSVLAQLLVNSRDSNIYKELVDNQQRVYDIQAQTMIRFDSGYFLISFEPKDINDVPSIIKLIHDEINRMATEGIDTNKLVAINRTSQSHHYNLMQNTATQADVIGINYLATGNKDALFDYIVTDSDELHSIIVSNLRSYVQPDTMHIGYILPANEDQQQRWHELQKASDEYDAHFLADKHRESHVEAPQWALTIDAADPESIAAPIPHQHTLSNGIEMLYHHNDTIPKITLKLHVHANHLYDQAGQEGLYALMKECMFEGTHHHPGHTFVKTCNDNAINISYGDKIITVSMLKEDFKQGLELLRELLTDCTFDERALTKIKQQLISDYEQLWDNPHAIAWQLSQQHIYKGHPFEKLACGTPETLNTITRDDIVEFYRTHITPHKAVLSIVGDIDTDTITTVCDDVLGAWHGPALDDIEYPELNAPTSDTISHYMNRDQVVVIYVRTSIDRLHHDFDALMLFDALLGQRLFELRERYGIFYTMHGASCHNASEQPGDAYISTIVSCDNVERVQDIITKALVDIPQSITQNELDHARRSLLEIPATLYSKNGSIANSFLFLHKYNLPFDYFEHRKETLEAISLDDVRDAAATMFNPEAMAIIRVGRV